MGGAIHRGDNGHQLVFQHRPNEVLDAQDTFEISEKKFDLPPHGIQLGQQAEAIHLPVEIPYRCQTPATGCPTSRTSYFIRGLWGLALVKFTRKSISAP